MKKIFTSALLIFIIKLTAMAQSVNLGVKLGLTNSYLRESISNQPATSTDAIRNIDPRICLNINFGNLTIQPGLAYYLKGGNNGGGLTFSGVLVLPSSTAYSAASFSSYRIHYLEIPVNILYNFPVGVGKFFIGGGPYMAIGLSAKSEDRSIIYSPGGVTQYTSSNSITFGSADSQLKQIDYGVNAQGGFRFKNGIELGVSTGFGLTNIANYSGANAKNRTASITLGYFFR